MRTLYNSFVCLFKDPLSVMLPASLFLAVAAIPAIAEEAGAVPEGKPTPEMLKELERKKLEAEQLRRKVKELEALLRMKDEISQAKSRAIKQLEASRKKQASEQADGAANESSNN